jgi:hypothetical protein
MQRRGVRDLWHGEADLKSLRGRLRWGLTTFKDSICHIIPAPVPAAVSCEACACSCSLAGIAGSNPAGVIDACVVCCTLKTKKQTRTINTKKKLRKSKKKEEEKNFRKTVPLRAFVFISFVFLCYVNSDLCDELITRSGKPYWIHMCVCVLLCVIYKSQKWCSLGRFWAVAPQKI